MHQKDELIETYENALWRLENGLPMKGNKLADRIQIIQKLEKQRNFEKEKLKKEKEKHMKVFSKQNGEIIIDEKKDFAKKQGSGKATKKKKDEDSV